jgi:hypothetical protein
VEDMDDSKSEEAKTPGYEKLQELTKKANSEQKKRHDETLQKLEQDMRKELQIPADSADKSLEELVSKVEALDHHNGEVQTRETSSDKLLLQTASNGLALRGVFLTKHHEDQLCSMNKLIEVPDKVVLTSVSQCEDYFENFSSVHQEDEYKKQVDTLGRSVAVSASYLFVSASVAASDKSENVNETQHHSKHMYSSSVKYSTVKLAGYSFEKHSIKLSSEARNALKKVSQGLTVHGPENGYVRDACKKFFKDYGSHAYRGPLSFGGHYWWICSSSGFSQEESVMLKEIQSKALSASVSGAYGGFGASVEASVSEVKGKYEGKCSKSTLASTQVKTKISGGPTNATNFTQWKSGIVANRTTWVVTDRGTEVMPVWEIIQENHKAELGALENVLKSTWEEVTGLKAEADMPKILSFDSTRVMEMVDEWNKQKSLTHQEVQDRLAYLREAKCDVLESTGKRRIWIDHYLLQSPLQQFLMSLVEKPFFKSIEFQVKLVVEQEDCNHLDTLNFPGFEKVYGFLYQTSLMPEPSKMGSNITSLEKLDLFLEKTLSELVIATSTPLLHDEEVSNEITVEVTQSIHFLRNCCKQTYDSILIRILMYPFLSSEHGNVMSLKPLTFKDLQFMHKLFSEERHIYAKYAQGDRPLPLQAYLLTLAMKVCLEFEPLQDLLQEIRGMMKILDPPLEQVLDELLNERSSFELLRDASEQILATGLQPSPSLSPPSGKKGNPLSLRNALRTKALQHELLPAKQPSLLFDKNPSAHRLLQKLGLCEYYPQKLQIEDALCIRLEALELSLGIGHPTDPSQLPNLILQKLMAYDCKCRSDLMNPEYGSQDAIEKSSDEKDSDSDSDGDDDDDDDDDDNGKGKMHPVDCLLAIILCSDDFLRQDLFSRLAKCQLAVPFMLFDPFTKQLTLPLWAMRAITKDFVVEGTKMKFPMIKHKMPLVSFMRFGEHPPMCLSKILNEVISGSSHNHFFHHDCRGGHYENFLVDGLVDMCWYLPAGKKTDAFSTAVTFLNLHGDGRQHLEQKKFLCQVSSMCFIHLTEKMELDRETLQTLKAFASSGRSITLLNEVGEKPSIFKQEGIKVYNVKMKTKNLAQVKDSIRSQINKHQGKVQLLSIEDCSRSLLGKSIVVDEESGLDSVQQGLKLAREVESKIKGERAIMIPLQAYWKDWSDKDKEWYRQTQLGNKSVHVYSDEIARKKKGIRESQLECAESLTPLMESFIVALLKLFGNSNRVARNYFLQSLKMKLDLFSMAKVSEKQFLYQSARTRLAELTNDKSSDNKSEILRCKKEMKKHMKDITDASFGLEHLFREIGQVYEAASNSVEIKEEELCCLPRAAAELLIEGYPLELMDGDVSHVPLVWITAVIDEAVKLLETVKLIKKPQIYVLSVLGIQSSGKSTMLNTVFGLQFNVSTGRCTRGAFMRLLPVDKSLKTNFSYVLVVDTEGLRAPELDPLTTQKHDNELATFVIGLANITLINIMGEVAADIDDILQTSVHAFLRMKQIENKPGCQFIHQNAEASKNNEVTHGNFTEKLNDFTALAAKAESLDGYYDSFNDVITFDDRKDVHYFPGLWKGDPLMDPVNQGYSDSAQQLKLTFIRSLCHREKDGSSDCHLSTFPTKLNDFWKALLTEDFVFSFRNTQEITAYSQLEQQYMKIEWRFKERMLDWEQKAENEISTAKSVSQTTQTLLEDLKNYVSEEDEHLKERLECLFNDEWSEILVKWKHSFEQRFETLVVDLEDHARNTCRKLEKSKVAISKIEEDRVNYTKIVTEKVHEVIAIMNQDRKLFDENLEKGKLNSMQLDELLKQNPFTCKELKKYRDQDLITPPQFASITEVMQKCGYQLTLASLRKILAILDVKQAKEIFNKEPTEEQLEVKFDSIWIGLISKLHLEKTNSLDVLVEVEASLRGFVKAMGYAGQLREKLRKKKQKEWGDYLRLVPVEGVHYRKGNVVVRGLEYIGLKKKGKHETACEVAGKVFTTARECLQAITAKDKDFNSSYTDQLLRAVDTELSSHLESEEVTNSVTFKPDFSLEIYLTVCGYAIPKFEAMSESFKERHNPKLYLEKYVKGPLCSDFKSQFRQIKAEEAIAKKLCACLEEPLKEQIERTSATKVVEMLRSEQHFTSKMALKVKILTDLYHKDEFESYMDYVVDIESSVKHWLLKYIVEHCDEKSSGEGTRLQVLLKSQVMHLIALVESEVNLLKATNAQECLSVFCDRKLKRELGIKLEVSSLQKGFESVKQLHLDNFKHQIKTGLQQLRMKLYGIFGSVTCRKKLGVWEDKFLEILGDLVGCTAQCPFCREQCDSLVPNHYKNGKKEHYTLVHRPDCLGAYRRENDNVMTLNLCPTLIAGTMRFSCKDTKDQWHPYKDYKSIYEEWSIPPDVTSQDSKYWMKFVSKYNRAIAEQFDAKPADVPKGWADFQWEEISKSLKDLYKYEAV